MNKLKQKIKNNFEQSMDSYSKHSEVQAKTAQKLFELLKNKQMPNGKIIDYGCGDLEHSLTLANWYRQTVTAIDLMTPRMFIPENISYQQLDFDDVCFENETVALSFSNMSLQWSSAIHQVFNRIFQSLKKEGIFVFSLPTVGTFQELNAAHRNTFHSSGYITKCLETVGFSSVECFEHQYTLNFCHQVDALRAIKKTGANTLLESRTKHKGLCSLNKLFVTDQPQLTYVIASFFVKK